MTGVKPADKFPDIDFNLVGGGTRKIQDWTGKWAMLIVYRGNHCPRCKSYVAKLQTLAKAYADRGVELLLASTDPESVAQRTIDENGWTLPVAYGSPEQSPVLWILHVLHQVFLWIQYLAGNQAKLAASQYLHRESPSSARLPSLLIQYALLCRRLQYLHF